MKRSSGVLMHISSLWGNYGIGSFGDEAKEFIDFLAAAGYSFWQVLPFCMPDEFWSPYQSYSAFAGNPYLIDLPRLYRDGLLTDSELKDAEQQSPYACEFARLEKERLPLLFRAAERVQNRAPIQAFLDENPEIEKFCRYMALREQNGGKVWCDWTVSEPDERLFDGWAFIQYTFFAQWEEIKRYANDRGVQLIGDIPIYVSYNSADVWANRELFELTPDGKPKNVAGVPPDYFCADGQLWGNPLYRWDRMKADGYDWWVRRIRTMLRLFDGVRIDHFRALDSYWSVPADAETAREGKWVKGPGYPFVKKLKEAAGDKLLIAEDLGDITPSVHELMKRAALPGMRVFQFAFLGDPASPHLPHNYPENCVAYTGTHDNNTLLGFMWEQKEHTRRRILRYCRYAGDDWNRSYDSILATMLASHAALVVFPIQDLLHYGSDCRLNTPGRATGNWSWRITKEQLLTLDSRALRDGNQLYGRI